MRFGWRLTDSVTVHGLCRLQGEGSGRNTRDDGARTLGDDEVNHGQSHVPGHVRNCWSGDSDRDGGGNRTHCRLCSLGGCRGGSAGSSGRDSPPDDGSDSPQNDVRYNGPSNFPDDAGRNPPGGGGGDRHFMLVGSEFRIYRDMLDNSPDKKSYHAYGGVRRLNRRFGYLAES
jgi:hypothetical protein